MSIIIRYEFVKAQNKPKNLNTVLMSVNSWLYGIIVGSIHFEHNESSSDHNIGQEYNKSQTLYCPLNLQ